MKLKHLMMVSCTAALLSGCVTTKSNSYCDITSPMYFNKEDVVDYLSEQDKDLLESIIIHNETWEKICTDL